MGASQVHVMYKSEVISKGVVFSSRLHFHSLLPVSLVRHF